MPSLSSMSPAASNRIVADEASVALQRKVIAVA